VKKSATSKLSPYLPHLANATWVLSFQTVAEMRFGALKAKWGARRRSELEEFFRGFTVLGYNDALVTAWAEIMVQATKVGRRLEAGDPWIAATSKFLSAPLLTHDQHFAIEACPSIVVHRYLPA